MNSIIDESYHKIKQDKNEMNNAINNLCKNISKLTEIEIIARAIFPLLFTCLQLTNLLLTTFHPYCLIVLLLNPGGGPVIILPS